MKIQELLPQTTVAFSWEGLALTKGRLENPPLNLACPEVSLEEALADLAQETGLVAQIFCAEKLEEKIDFKKFLEHLGYTQIDRILEIQDFLKSLPDEFKNWLLEKKAHTRDFNFFLYDYNKDHAEDFKSLALLNPTKSLGFKIIDLYLDLIAQKKIETGFITTFKNADLLFKSLNKKRFEKTLKEDEAFEKELHKFSLKNGLDFKSQRQGDQRLLKAELRFFSIAEGKKQIESLQSQLNEIEKGKLL